MLRMLTLLATLLLALLPFNAAARSQACLDVLSYLMETRRIPTARLADVGLLAEVYATNTLPDCSPAAVERDLQNPKKYAELHDVPVEPANRGAISRDYQPGNPYGTPEELLFVDAIDPEEQPRGFANRAQHGLNRAVPPPPSLTDALQAHLEDVERAAGACSACSRSVSPRHMRTEHALSALITDLRRNPDKRLNPYKRAKGIVTVSKAEGLIVRMYHSMGVTPRRLARTLVRRGATSQWRDLTSRFAGELSSAPRTHAGSHRIAADFVARFEDVSAEPRQPATTLSEELADFARGTDSRPRVNNDPNIKAVKALEERLLATEMPLRSSPELASPRAAATLEAELLAARLAREAHPVPEPSWKSVGREVVKKVLRRGH